MKSYENYQEDTNLMEGVNKPMNMDGQNNNQEQLVEAITFGPIEEQNNYYQQQPTTNNYQQPVYNITNNYYQQPNLVEPIMFIENPILYQLMTEEDMLNNTFARMKYINKPKALEVLDKIKYLNTDCDGYMTLPIVADYFEIGYRTLQKAIQRNRRELLSNGMLILTGERLKKYKASRSVGDKNSLTRVANLILLDRRCVLNIAMLLRDSVIAQAIRYTILNALNTDEGKELTQQTVNREASRIKRIKV